jgi:hypothetical protein
MLPYKERNGFVEVNSVFGRGSPVSYDTYELKGDAVPPSILKFINQTKLIVSR